MDSSKGMISTYAAPVISAITLGVFCVAYLIAYLSKDGNSLTMMSGAIIGMAGTVVNFWVGSSSGSQAKDVTIAAQSAATSAVAKASAAAPVVVSVPPVVAQVSNQA